VIFISAQFATFFAVVAAAYFCLPHRVRWIWLLGASLSFYAVLEPLYAVLALAASAVAFGLALRMEKAASQRARRTLLAVGLAALVGNLAVFKYAGFLNETLRALLGADGAEHPVSAFGILPPLGISFYTLQLVGYLVDVYRGEKAERHFGLFALYVTLFVKIIAGPIERARTLIPQLRETHLFEYARVVAGLQLIAWGVFKKAVVADRIAPIVSGVYDHVHAFDGAALAFATWLYAFQIYCDFSGYTDMALGGALILGFKLTGNFNRPYFATSLADFWRRWHVSLTSWLEDYVHRPLTRSQLARVRWRELMLASLFITFLARGLWQGGAWTYVAWGGLHGGLLVASLALAKPWDRLARRLTLEARPALHRALKIAATFTAVCAAFVLFRASSLADAGYVYASILTHFGDPLAGARLAVGEHGAELVLALGGVAVVMLAEALQGRIDLGAAIKAQPAWRRWGLYYAGATAVVLLGAFYGVDRHFIYFGR